MKWSALIVALAAVMSMAGGASAQSFGDLPGLEDAVVRAWMAPGESNGTPAATDGPGVVFLSIGIFDFESDATSAPAYTQFAMMAEESAQADPLMAGASIGPIPGKSDQSTAAIATREDQGIPFTTIFAVARKGDLLYVIQASLVRVDGPDELERMTAAVIATPIGGEPTFVPEGTSKGGLWDKLNAAKPTLMPGSFVFDSIIFPTPAGTETPAA
jgi:hypothetical protein